MMTFEEAKDVFLNHGWIKVGGGTYFDGSKWREAVRVLSDYLKREPCDDCISRQAVLDHIYGINGLEGFELSNVFEKHYADFIKSLPSVIPQPKMGHWIKNEWGNISCSSCGCAALYDKVYPGESVFGKAIRVKSTFCPTCGAKMQEVEE